jgi:hypothetical protein
MRPALALRRLVLLLAPVAVLALAGCGGDGDDNAGATRTATTPATPSATTTTPVTRQAPQTETERVSGCLRKLGYRLSGGAPQTKDSASPRYQIVLDSRHGGGYIGLYKNVSRATRVAKQLRKNAKRTTGASVERHGSINILWIDLPDPAARESVRGCLVT